MKKKIGTLLYGILLIGVVFTCQVAIENWALFKTPVTEAFLKLKPDWVEGKITGSADFGDKFLSEADKKDMISYLFRYFDMEPGEIQYKRGKETVSMLCTQRIEDRELKLELLTILDHPYLSFEMTVSESLMDTLAEQKKWEENLKKLGSSEYDTSLLLTGIYKGKMTLEEMDEKVELFVEDTKSKRVSEIKEERLYSICGYSPDWKKEKKVDGKKINWNMAFYYDEEEETTTCLLGIPVLYEDY